MKSDRRKYIIFCALYLGVIFFITLLSRTPTLSRITHLIPLWSYGPLLSGKWSYARQILLNIVLFIPLGYFLRGITRNRITILLSVVISLSVELLQFATYRGMLDVDDLISNLLGGIIGIGIYTVVGKKSSVGVRSWTERGLLVAGFIGCLMVAVPSAKSSLSTQITKQFWFDSSVAVVDNDLILDGDCYTYDRATPSYELFLNEVELKRAIDGESYSAVAPLQEQRGELQVKFRGYHPMSTGIWIRSDGSIDYIAEDVETPIDVPDGAILKAYSSEFDTYVYECDGKVLWLIGWDGLDKNTEIIYHLHTDEPEKLPENRKQYKFDNRGFRDGTAKEKKQISNYRVFEDIIPTDYNVTAIVVGFNTEGTIMWNTSFRPNKILQKPTH